MEKIKLEMDIGNVYRWACVCAVCVLIGRLITILNETKPFISEGNF